MRILLDTPTLLWALADPARLSARARSLCADMGNSLVVSAATAWEIAIKSRLGRLRAGRAILRGYRTHLAALTAEELPIRSEHAVRAAGLPPRHGDIFDRLIAAQAEIDNLPILGNDKVFEKMPIRRIW